MISSTRHISALTHPEMEPYRTLRRPMTHLEQGIFVAEGEKVVMRLLESNLDVVSILISHDRVPSMLPLIEQHHSRIDLFVGEKPLLDTIVGHDLHQAIMAVARTPEPLSIHDMIHPMITGATDLHQRRLFVMVDGITNAENMGVIIRNCACFGVDAVIVLPSSCDPYLRRSVRNSMGNIFKMPIVYLGNAATIRHDITVLKEHGIQFYAAHPHPRSIDIRTITLPRISCIVLGAEGHGISQDVLSHCDEFFVIPMKEGVDSLNVSSAGAVALWELQKNR
jgi:tRNA G18 (ribose-2'-O)-methylase SpoU